MRFGRSNEPTRTRGFASLQLLDDVVAHVLGGGRRVGVQRHAGKRVAQGAELAVLGAEVVAPHADAVRLVDGDERQVLLPEEASEAVHHQPLGRDVEDLDVPPLNGIDDVVLLVGRLRAVEPRRGDAALTQRVDLVLHQRDERRDDDGEPGEDESGRLEAEGLAAAGGKDDERVAAVERALHRLALQRAEIAVAPMLAQHRSDPFHLGTPGRMVPDGM